MTSMERSLSARGKGSAAPKPTFLDVLSDLWAPESDPDGIVNIGLTENVRNDSLRYFDTIVLNICLEPFARGDGNIYQT